MNILKMVMFETNGATEMPAKPYELDLRHGTGDIIEELDELTVGGTNVNSMALSRLASGILVPSTAPRATRIDGGWTERRIMFAMVVEVQGSSTGNYSDIRYITGYTDRSDYSNQRGRVHFPDDMRLYFNSIVRISLNQVSSRGGRRTLPTIRDNNLLLRRDSIISERGRDRGIRDNRPSLLRPADVLKRASSSHYIKDMLSTIPDSISKNTVGKFNLSTQLSKRKNNNSAEHMTTTLKSYMYARSHGEDDATNAGFPISRDGESLDIEPDYMVSAATSAIAAEDTMGSDPLFDEMRRFTNILEDGYIEWGELKRMAPDFDEDRDLPFTPWNARERTLTRSSRGEYDRGIADYNNSASFYDNTPESIAALMIAQAIPEILINSMYSMVKGLIINTHPQRGEPDVHYSVALPFVDGIPLEYGYNYMRNQFSNVVLPNVSKNGLIHIEAMINAHVDNDIEIWISVDGGPETYFVYPVWGESIISPVITDDERDLSSISNGISGLMEDFAIKVESKNSRTLEVATPGEIFGKERKRTTFGADPIDRSGSRRGEESSNRDRDERRPLRKKLRIDI